MARTETRDVVIVGGGIAGIATAYYLGQAGVKSLVVERDAVGSHASGFAYGGLGGLGGPETPGPILAMLTQGMSLHRRLSEALPEETGVNTEFRHRPTLALAFTQKEAKAAKTDLRWQQKWPGYSVTWLDRDALKSLDPRISPEALGGVYAEGLSEVEPYRLVLAMAQAAERNGAVIRHGRVTGLRQDGGRVVGVNVEQGEHVSCTAVVLAMGPWSEEAATWLNTPVPIRPLKGQILRLRAPGAPYHYSAGWNGNYAITKTDGLVWSGTTEEEVGFDERPTHEARELIMASLLKMLPSLENAELVRQTACLRPLAADRLPILGRAPGLEGVLLATGAGRQGIVLGPAMGRVTADLITTGKSDLPIEAFALGRFAR